MDCIDHSTNATAFLRSMERWGLLRFHRAGDPVQRGIFLSLHLAASVVALGSGDVYAVDSWFYDPGNPATIYTLDEWRRGKRPPGTELFRWSKY